MNPLANSSSLARRRLHPSNWGSLLSKRLDANRIMALAKKQPKHFDGLDDLKIEQITTELKFRFRSDEFNVEEFAASINLVDTAIRHELGISLYDQQWLAGLKMFDSHFVEMATGEGKTLAAALPLFVRALSGQGAWLATSNDYLAERDAQMLRPVFERLGMSVAAVTGKSSAAQRKTDYGCDIVYTTVTEIGFDFLRDRIRKRSDSCAERSQRRFHSILIDEVDSILIDDATTPLVISRRNESCESDLLYHWAAQNVNRFSESRDFVWDIHQKSADLTLTGMHLARECSQQLKVKSGATQNNNRLYEYVERAIQVDREFQRDREYLIRNGEVQIIDQSTGRLCENRKYRNGIQQAIEAKEKIDMSSVGEKTAQISIQTLVKMFPFVSGMSGTIGRSAREFKTVFGSPSFVVPTHQPSKREILPTICFENRKEKWRAVCEEAIEFQRQGRPVLIGTSTIAASEELSLCLDERNIEHHVLNARQDENEAKLIARAGREKQITIATDIAGRGTDIKIDDSVRELGGLHVIVAEVHSSKRIDRQLIGRCGRQGDPATARVFVARDDDLLAAAFGKSRLQRWLASTTKRSKNWWIAKLEKAQDVLEKRDLLRRRRLLYSENEKRKLQIESGFDPFLDNFDD